MNRKEKSIAVIDKLKKIASDKADNSNFSRASYCAGRAGCDDIRDKRDRPEDFLEWKAANEIEFWMEKAS